MSLADAVNAIADEMDSDADAAEDAKSLFCSLKGYAKQLRIAVKASAGSERQAPVLNPLMTADTQHFIEIEKARQEIRQQRAQAVSEEREPIMTGVVGGRSDGTHVTRDPEMPDGAKMRLGDEIYVLKDGKLNLVP